MPPGRCGGAELARGEACSPTARDIGTYMSWFNCGGKCARSQSKAWRREKKDEAGCSGFFHRFFSSCAGLQESKSMWACAAHRLSEPRVERLDHPDTAASGHNFRPARLPFH